MKPKKFHEKIKPLIDQELPDYRRIVASGRETAAGARIGMSEFMKQTGVSSEIEYKRQCIKEGRINYHAHVGLNSWPETVDGLRDLHAYCTNNGFAVDRFGVALDRRMGLPESARESAPKETGPLLTSPEQWLQLGSTVPIQPHMGDFIIGFPASVENTLHALSAGATTVGNLSQFFCHDVPMWDDRLYTLQQTVKALAVMGALSDRGALTHSYLDDGMGALFLDCTTVAGWAYMERYIIEELLGGKIGHCVGGLVTDPLKRMAWVFALDQIHDRDCVGTMFYGDTLSFSHNFETNTAHVGEYLLWDILAQLKCPTGHAVLPVPVTEAIRIPTIDEICRIQDFGHRVEATARRMLPYFDFSPAEKLGTLIAEKGKTVFRNAIDGLREAGVDIKDPVRLLFLLKNMGAALFEETFGAGRENPLFPRNREPVVPNDIFEQSNRQIEQLDSSFKDHAFLYQNKRILMASTDVHEHALYIMERLFGENGADVVNLGAECDPSTIAREAMRVRPDFVMISTHNGMALEYAHQLLEEIKELGVNVRIVMGGVLNQKTDTQTFPVDVGDDLQKLGIRVSTHIGDIWSVMEKR